MARIAAALSHVQCLKGLERFQPVAGHLGFCKQKSSSPKVLSAVTLKQALKHISETTRNNENQGYDSDFLHEKENTEVSKLSMRVVG